MGVTREEAMERIESVPKYIQAPCPRCGAATVAEGEGRCQPRQDITGDYTCGTPDDAPEDGGMLHQLNPEFLELTDYLWGWVALDEGYTTTPPVWREGEREGAGCGK